MTATPDLKPDEQLADTTTAEPPREQPEQAKPEETTAPHTDVPAPLAGPARRAALALGVPSVGLAELLVHANFGWAGVAVATGVVAAGAGVAYAARRRNTAKTERSKVGASSTPARRPSLSPTGRAGRRAERRAERGGFGASRAGGRRRGGGLIGRMLSGRGTRPGPGGHGTRRAATSTGHAAGRVAGRGTASKAVGARAAAANAPHLTRGRAGGVSGGIRQLSTRGHNTKRRGRHGSHIGGGSFFGGHGRPRGQHSPARRPKHPGRGWGLGMSWGSSTTRATQTRGTRPAPHRPRPSGRWPRPRHVPWRPLSRGVGVILAAGAACAVGAAVGTALVGIAGGYYGGRWLATSPRIRYGATVIAGWVRLGLSRAYQWARRQWWKAMGRSSDIETYIADGEPVDEPSASPAPENKPVVEDAEIVPEPQASRPSAGRAPVLGGHQPAVRALPAGSLPRQPRYQPRLGDPTAPTPTNTNITKEQISMSMQTVIEAITNRDTFVPNDGPDTQAHLRGYVQALRALSECYGNDMQSIVQKLPQFENELHSLAHIGDALAAFAEQADQAFEQWRQGSSWVWQDQES